ncbi:MAG: response regulator transcription factor [Bacteroidetes bacterium]|nr:response regulator transcription factor [Bacteroidota bacterium]
MKLILVDDNLSFLEVLKFFIENKLGHQVIAEANNGEEFLALGNIGEAEVILMDLIMKKTDGIEAAKKAILRFPDLKLVAMTMNTEKAVKDRLKETGFKGVISKNEIFVFLESILQSVYSNKVEFSEIIKSTMGSRD